MKTSFRTYIAFAAIIFATQSSTASVKQLIGDRTNNWNTGTSFFEGYDSTTYEYDGSGKITLSHGFVYNSVTGWKETSQIVYTYSGSLLANKTTYNVSSGTQVNTYKVDYTYNGNNLLITDARWLWVSNAWLGVNRYTSAYDAQQRLITYTTESWVSGNWKNLRREQYATFTGNTPTLVTKQNWVSNLWVNAYQYNHILYSSSIKDSAVHQYNWSTVSSNWYAFGYTIFTYNVNGDMASQEFFEWVDIIGGTLPWAQWRYDYSYTSNVLTYVYKQLAVNNGSLDPNQRTTFTLDANNHWLTAVQEHYNLITSVWENYQKEFFTYDNDGDLRHHILQNWTSGNWINYNEDYYWYSTTLSGVEEIAETKSLKVFPNPFTQRATVEFNLNESGKAKIEVFDLDGRLVQQVEAFMNDGVNQWQLNFNELNSGLYFIKIETAKERFVQRVSKL